MLPVHRESSYIHVLFTSAFTHALTHTECSSLTHFIQNIILQSELIASSTFPCLTEFFRQPKAYLYLMSHDNILWIMREPMMRSCNWVNTWDLQDQPSTHLLTINNELIKQTAIKIQLQNVHWFRLKTTDKKTPNLISFNSFQMPTDPDGANNIWQLGASFF